MHAATDSSGPGPSSSATSDLAALAARGRLLESLRDALHRSEPELELEAKLTVVHDADDPRVLLDLALPVGADLGDVLVDRCGVTAEMTPRYYVGDGVEYSRFVYEGSELLKIKRHDVVDVGGMPVMRSEETFEHDPARIDALVAGPGIEPVGSMTKRRAKHFLFDTGTGRAYSAAATVCTHEGRYQRQLEIEYYGDAHLPPLHGHVGSIAEDVAALARRVMAASRVDLVPASERKLDFLLATSQ